MLKSLDVLFQAIDAKVNVRPNIRRSLDGIEQGQTISKSLQGMLHYCFLRSSLIRHSNPHFCAQRRALYINPCA